jgi:hypothetical protein
MLRPSPKNSKRRDLRSKRLLLVASLGRSHPLTNLKKAVATMLVKRADMTRLRRPSMGKMVRQIISKTPMTVMATTMMLCHKSLRVESPRNLRVAQVPRRKRRRQSAR